MPRRRLHWLGAAVLVAIATYAVGDAIVSPAPISSSPGFVETIMARRAVVAAVRIAVIFAAGFIVVSVVALTAKRQWPARIGPVHLRHDVSGQEIETGQLRSSLSIANATIEDLKQDLAAATGDRNRLDGQ